MITCFLKKYGKNDGSHDDEEEEDKCFLKDLRAKHLAKHYTHMNTYTHHLNLVKTYVVETTIISSLHIHN